MTRRDAIGSVMGTLGLAAQAPAKKPNLIFFLADDLGYGDLGCYGQKMIPTPHLDALAAEGTRFEAAYAGSTVCAPSRCALMTGYHTGHTTIRGNGKNETVLRKEDVTIAELLKSGGYRTGIFGKWGLGKLGYPGYPTKKGFDEWFGYFSQSHAHNYYPEMLHHNDSFVELNGNTGKRRADYAPDVIHERAMKWMDQQREPFFLYYNSTIPHANNELGRDTGNGQEVPEDSPFGGKDWPQVEKNFAAMVSRLDRIVGSTVEHLKKNGQWENTLLVFTSDNGPHKEGGHNADFFDSNGPLRGTKRDLSEGGIRVPAIAVWANQIPRGVVNPTPWAFWDVLPTFCEAAGLSAPKGIDGISVLDTWKGKSQKSQEYFYWEFHEGGFAQAARKGNWKAIRSKTGKVELFDLSTDLGEARDLAGEQPKVLAEMQRLFTAARTESTDWPTRR
jgi:arylsulfatase A-like enzyme